MMGNFLHDDYHYFTLVFIIPLSKTFSVLMNSMLALVLA